jgi:hypothetical protein
MDKILANQQDMDQDNSKVAEKQVIELLCSS